VEAAFHQALAADPTDARAPLNLGRYLTSLSRPAEAIAHLYSAAAINAETFKDVKLGVGTAKAQQGRLREAISNFASASRMSPKDTKLAASLVEMESHAAQVEAMEGSNSENAVMELCGTPCQAVIDGSGINICGITWADGCGDVQPPPGFSATSTVAELCAQSCMVYRASRHPVAMNSRAAAGE